MARDVWARGFPDGCIDPDHKGDRLRMEHEARGFCRTCNRRRARLIREGRADEIPVAIALFETGVEGNGSSPSTSDGDPLVADDAPTVEEAVIEEPSDSPNTTRERRPGTVGTPSPSPDAAGTSTSGRIRGWLNRNKSRNGAVASPALPAPGREKRPGSGRGGRRESAADTISDGWSALGGVVVRTGHVPTGRCLQWQAPMAGEMIDDAVKGTMVDKLVLQRVVRGRQRFDLLGAVLGPPLIVFAIERNPAQAETLIPILRSSIRHSLPLMVPAIKRLQKKEQDIAEATALLFEDDPNFDGTADPVDYILSMMFDGWAPPPPAPVTEEPVTEPVP